MAVSVDGGVTWDDAQLGDSLGSHAWRSGSYVWEAAKPGERQLVCRAWDSVGNVQPLEPRWNLGGYANNAVQRITVTVTPR